MYYINNPNEKPNQKNIKTINQSNTIDPFKQENDGKLKNELEIKEKFKIREKLINVKSCSHCGANIKNIENIYCEYCNSKLI